MDLADSTDVVVGDVPSPGSNSVPFSNFNFHRDGSKLESEELYWLLRFLYAERCRKVGGVGDVEVEVVIIYK
jgi:hypothetical protein